MKKKIILLKILDALDINNRLLRHDDLGVSSSEFRDILEIMFEAGLIYNNIVVQKGLNSQVIKESADQTRLTLNGIEYLDENYNLLEK